MKTKEQMLTPAVVLGIRQYFLGLINVTDLCMVLIQHDLSVIRLTSDDITLMSDSDAASLDFTVDNPVFPLRLTVTPEELAQ